MTTHDTKFEQEDVALSRRGFQGLLGKGVVCAGALVGANGAIGSAEVMEGKRANADYFFDKSFQFMQVREVFANWCNTGPPINKIDSRVSD